MAVPSLPKGWQQWPEAQLTELLSGLQALASERDQGRVPWLCDVPGCDGKPHKGRRGPHARSDQHPPPGDVWDVWLALAGRGWGKTRTGAEWAIRQARTLQRGALVGPTAGDARDILVEGESGIMACAPATFRPLYEPSKRRLTYPNGAIQTVYSADEPDRLRGPQHHYAWADEMAAWRRLQMTWDMLQLGMRLGTHPRICITTTPRPLPLIKELVKDGRCSVVRGSTYDNLHNLADTFKRAVLDKYEGTTLGSQELHAEILADLPGALVKRAHIDTARLDAPPEMDLVVVGVDPAGTGTGDEAGIVVVGRTAKIIDDEGNQVQRGGDLVVLADLSGQMSARKTGLTAWGAVYDYNATVLVYEDNLGKQWVRDGLIDAFADYHELDNDQRAAVRGEDAEALAESGGDLVSPFDPEHKPIPNPYRYLRKVTAVHGKKLRAQPVGMRYEQRRVHHVQSLPELEDQLTTWNPDEDTDSPDRVDALVHAATHIIKRERSVMSVASPHAIAAGPARGAAVHPILRMIGRRS